MGSAMATRCRLTYGNRARGFHQGQSSRSLANRPVIVTQSFLCLSALQFRASPYSSIFGPCQLHASFSVYPINKPLVPQLSLLPPAIAPMIVAQQFEGRQSRAFIELHGMLDQGAASIIVTAK